MGTVNGLGATFADTWKAVLDDDLGYERRDEDDALQVKFVGKPIEHRSRSILRSATVRRALPDFAHHAVTAADEALRQAFPDLDELGRYQPFERGVVFGTGYGWWDHAQQFSERFRGDGITDTFYAVKAMPSAASGGISINWNMRGPQLSPAAACATGNVAIGEAAKLIESGRAKIVIAGGADTVNQPMSLWSVDVLRALSKEQDDASDACCPFDVRRSGFVPASGAAALCLEDYDSALARGATILAVVTAYGCTSDATELTNPAKDCLGRRTAIDHALAEAGVAPADVDVISAHGTSTPANDLNELQVLQELFGGQRAAISSLKGHTGHTLGAAGALEAIVGIKAMAEQTVTATANLDTPESGFDLDLVYGDHRRERSIGNTLNLSFGFGGVNAALMMEAA